MLMNGGAAWPSVRVDGVEAPEWLPGRTVPITVAPSQRASWAAIDPTAPSTPWTRIVAPAAAASPKTAGER